MADSVYISKNLNEEQLQFMQRLDASEILYFNMQIIEAQLDMTFSNLNEVLENLVDKGLLRRLEKGKYVKADYAEIFPLACFLGKNGVIAYWSALHHHGLSERFPNTTFVKIDFRKKEGDILGSTIKYVSVKAAKKAFGVQTEGYGYNRYSITNVETTLIDCFDQLRYAGDFPDLIRAFASASLRNQMLIDGCKLYQNVALTKRLGYLASIFQPDKLSSFIRYAKTQVNTRYNLFEAGGPDKGAFNAEWKLRFNLSESAILQIINDSY
jgi:predicted transcriptional regulator of viral defense system